MGLFDFAGSSVTPKGAVTNTGATDADADEAAQHNGGKSILAWVTLLSILSLMLILTILNLDLITITSAPASQTALGTKGTDDATAPLPPPTSTARALLLPPTLTQDSDLFSPRSSYESSVQIINGHIERVFEYFRPHEITLSKEATKQLLHTATIPLGKQEMGGISHSSAEVEEAPAVGFVGAAEGPPSNTEQDTTPATPPSPPQQPTEARVRERQRTRRVIDLSQSDNLAGEVTLVTHEPATVVPIKHVQHGNKLPEVVAIDHSKIAPREFSPEDKPKPPPTSSTPATVVLPPPTEDAAVISVNEPQTPTPALPATPSPPPAAHPPQHQPPAKPTKRTFPRRSLEPFVFEHTPDTPSQFQSSVSVFDSKTDVQPMEPTASLLEPHPTSVRSVLAEVGVRKYRLACELKHGFDPSEMGELGLGRMCMQIEFDAPIPQGKYVFTITHTVETHGGTFHVRHETCQSCRMFLSPSKPITNWVAENYGPDLIELKVFGPEIVAKRLEPITAHKNWPANTPEGNNGGEGLTDVNDAEYSLNDYEIRRIKVLREKDLWRSYCSIHGDQNANYPPEQHQPPMMDPKLNEETSDSHPAPLECEYQAKYNTVLTGMYRIHLQLIYTAYQALGDWNLRTWNQIWPRAQNIELALWMDESEYLAQNHNEPVKSPRKLLQRIVGSDTFERRAWRAAQSFDRTTLSKRMKVIDDSADHSLALIPFTSFAPGGVWVSLNSLVQKLPQASHKMEPLQFWPKDMKYRRVRRFQCQLIDISQYQWVPYEQRLLNSALPRDAEQPTGKFASYMDEFERMNWDMAKECLKGKKIAFMGDSQTRTIFSRTVQLIGGPQYEKFKAVKQKFIEGEGDRQWECIEAEGIELCYLPMSDFYSPGIASGMKKADFVVLNAGQHQASGPRRDSLDSYYAKQEKAIDWIETLLFGHGSDSLRLPHSKLDSLYYWFMPYFPRNNANYTFVRGCGEGRTNPRMDLFNAITLTLFQSRNLLASPSHLLMDVPHIGFPFQDCAGDGAHQDYVLFDVYIGQLIRKFMLNLKCPIVGNLKKRKGT